jgi:hypothetical protein
MSRLMGVPVGFLPAERRVCLAALNTPAVPRPLSTIGWPASLCEVGPSPANHKSLTKRWLDASAGRTTH